MKKYFFGYLFVRIAKILAGLVIVVGLGFALLKYSQATVASASANYQASSVLSRSLDAVADAFGTTQEAVKTFNSSNQTLTPPVRGANFSRRVESNSDFERLGQELFRIDRERGQLKQSIINRFELLVNDIEQRLRAHAVALQATPTPIPTTSASPTASPIPTAVPAKQQPSLFSADVRAGEIDARTTQLNNGREFLKVLGTKAENSENRAKLIEAADQLDALAKLLPEKEELPLISPSQSSEPESLEPRVEHARKVVAAEKVADQLQQLRARVRQALLTSWILDEAFDQAFTLAATEKERCRLASLQQKGIWLGAGGEIVSRLVAAALISFLILVFADLTQTQLDTAINTGIAAEELKRFKS